MSQPGTPSMLFFDVLGTVVEWRFCIANQLKAAAERALQDEAREIGIDVRGRVSGLATSTWDEIADEWHRSYMNFGRTYDPSKPFVSVDEHNRISLGNIFANRRLLGLFKDDDLQHLALGWHRLDPYPEVCKALRCSTPSFRPPHYPTAMSNSSKIYRNMVLCRSNTSAVQSISMLTSRHRKSIMRRRADSD